MSFNPDWESWSEDEPAAKCYDCNAVFDPRDIAEIEAHREEHWADYLRSQCPIPPPPWEPLPKFVMAEEDEEVPF